MDLPPKPVYLEWFKERIMATQAQMAKAQELLCPFDNSEMKDISNEGVGGGQCPKCGKVFFWRLDP